MINALRKRRGKRAPLGLGLAFAVALQLPALADTQCTLKRAGSLDLETESSGEVTIPVLVENHAARFTIDTGAAFSLLATTFARSIGHEPRLLPNGSYFGMVGGYKLHDMVTVDSFAIGMLHAGRTDFVAIPSEAISPGAMGILGSNVLAAYDVEIDFAAQKFNIFSQDHCAGQVVYWTKSPFAEVPMTLGRDLHITIPVTLDGKQVRAIVDTGAYRSYMTLDNANDLFGLDENSQGLKKVGDTELNGVAAATIYKYPFQSLTFQDVSVRNPDIEISKEGKRTPGMPQLIVGMGIIRQLHIYVAYGERTLYLTPASAH